MHPKTPRLSYPKAWKILSFILVLGPCSCCCCVWLSVTCCCLPLVLFIPAVFLDIHDDRIPLVVSGTTGGIKPASANFATAWFCLWHSTRIAQKDNFSGQYNHSRWDAHFEENDFICRAGEGHQLFSRRRLLGKCVNTTTLLPEYNAVSLVAMVAVQNRSPRVV